jgi:hypothetical protein
MNRIFSLYHRQPVAVPKDVFFEWHDWKTKLRALNLRLVAVINGMGWGHSLRVVWMAAAILFALGLSGQAVASTVATPVINVPSGQAYTQFNVTVTDSTSGATLYYTLDGTTPTSSSSSITSGQTIAISQIETLLLKVPLPGIRTALLPVPSMRESRPYVKT